MKITNRLLWYGEESVELHDNTVILCHFRRLSDHLNTDLTADLEPVALNFDPILAYFGTYLASPTSSSQFKLVKVVKTQACRSFLVGAIEFGIELGSVPANLLESGGGNLREDHIAGRGD